MPIQEAQRRALICSLIKAMREKGSWAGETHIQKCVYFLQEMLDVRVGYEYILYKHGPYCFDLQRELAVMRARLLLDVEPRYPYGPSFKLGLRGERSLEGAAQYEVAIRFVAQNFSIRDVRELERLSTAFFVKTENSGLENNRVARQVNELKPHIDTATAREAVNEIDLLQLEARRSFLTT